MPRLRRLLAAGTCLLAFSTALGSCTQRTHRPQVDVVRLSTFEGDPYTIGLQHGSQLSGEINQFYGEFLRNALLPFLNRERTSLVDVLTFYTTSPLYEAPNFAPQLLLEAAKSMVDGIPSPRREAFLAELHGIADGSGLPFADTMILNTFLDSVTSILNVNYILDGLDNPRVQQINFDASFDADGLDNDGDGIVDEPNEHIFGVERRSSAFALARGQPADRPIQVRIADTQLTCNRLIEPDPTCRSCEEGEDPFDPDTGERVCFEADLQFGEGIDLNKPRNPENPEERGLLRVNGVFLRRCMNDEAACDGYKDNGIETFVDGELVVTTPPKTQATLTIFPPAGGWRTDEPNIVEFRVLDLAETIVPPPLHANDMRRERLSFLATATPGADPRSLHDFPNLIPAEARLDAETYALGVQGSLTADGRTRVLRHFQLLDNDVAHKFARIMVFKPTGKPAYMTLSWSGFAAGITGMGENGIFAGANWAETQDDSTATAAVPALGILSPAIGQILIEKVDLFPNGAPNALRDPKAGKDYLCYDPAGSPNAATTDPAPVMEDDRCCEARLLGDVVAEYDDARDLCRVRSCFVGPDLGDGKRLCTFGVKKCETVDGEEVCDVVGGVLQPTGVPIGLRLRQIFEEADDLNEAISFFDAPGGASAAGWNVLLADGDAPSADPAFFDSAPTEANKCKAGGPAAPALALVELDAGAPLKSILDFILGTDSRGFKHDRDVACGRTGDASLVRAGATVSETRADLRACTHFQINVPDSQALGTISTQSVWATRYPVSTDTCGVLAEAVRDGAGTLDDFTLEDLFRDPRIVSRRASMHGGIFDPGRRSVRVALGELPVTEGPFNDYDCAALGFANCPEAAP